MQVVALGFERFSRLKQLSKLLFELLRNLLSLCQFLFERLSLSLELVSFTCSSIQEDLLLAECLGLVLNEAVRLFKLLMKR